MEITIIGSKPSAKRAENWFIISVRVESINSIRVLKQNSRFPLSLRQSKIVLY